MTSAFYPQREEAALDKEAFDKELGDCILGTEDGGMGGEL